MTRFRKRTDSNHAAIRDALRAAGWTVRDLSGAGLGLPDLYAYRPGRAVWLEIKDGSKPASRRKLTPAQVELHTAFQQAGTPIRVITSVQDVETLA